MNRGNLMKVNIYTKLPEIPMLGKRKASPEWEVDPQLYRILKQDPRIEIYPVDNDPRNPKAKKVESVIQPTKPQPKIDSVSVETKQENLVVNVVYNKPIVIEEVKQSGIITAKEIIDTTNLADSEIDTIIENRLNELPEEKDSDFQMNFDDNRDNNIEIIIPVAKGEVDLSDPVSYKYTEKELSKLTKAQMKQILVARGHIDDELTGRYHDTLEKLMAKVFKTQ